MERFKGPLYFFALALAVTTLWATAALESREAVFTPALPPPPEFTASLAGVSASGDAGLDEPALPTPATNGSAVAHAD